MEKKTKADILICGAGIVGLTIARELIKKRRGNIIIIEKEGDLGLHASGRNSGVLHAGIYYSKDTLRAKSCLKGNFMMKEYCKQKKLPLFQSGKVIVTKNEGELETLKQLYDRAIANGAKVDIINEKELNKIEPNAKTFKQALYSHYTAVVSPKKILKSLHDDLIKTKKVKIFFNTKFESVKDSSVITNNGEIYYDLFINAAGAYSDKIAHSFGLGKEYKLIPFKGIYRKLKKEKNSMIKGSIYPVPDIRNPFLGVHYTRGIDGEVYLGPTAIPALGRENYGILSGMDIEAFEILLREAILFFADPKFRDVALIEPRKYYPPYFFNDAKKLVKEIDPNDVISSDKAGIRPQLVDWKKKELVMDFKILREANSLHILNAISPAFTASMDFAKFVVDDYVKK